MPKTYITTSGDKWDLIAKKTLGNEMHMNALMQANIRHRNTFIFPAGIELVIPDIPAKPPEGLPPWKRGRPV